MSCGLENCGLELAPVNGYDPVTIERGFRAANRAILKLAELLLGGQIVRDDDGDIVREDGDIVRHPPDFPGGVIPPIVHKGVIVKIVEEPQIFYVMVLEGGILYRVNLYPTGGGKVYVRLGDTIIFVPVGDPKKGEYAATGPYQLSRHNHWATGTVWVFNQWSYNGTYYYVPDELAAVVTGPEVDDGGGHHHHEVWLKSVKAWDAGTPSGLPVGVPGP